MAKFEVGCANQTTNTNSYMDIFEQTPCTTWSEPTTKLVTIELLIFKSYQVDPKEIKCPFQRKGKHFFDLPNPKDCWILRLKRIFFSNHIYKLEKMSYIIK
jgi:hypothetical protein